MTAKWELLEHVARTALDASAPRRMAVLDPLQVRQARARRWLPLSIPSRSSDARCRLRV
jgi:hypothetical protein